MSLEASATALSKNCWDSLWSTTPLHAELDALSERIETILLDLKSKWNDTTVLEAGSGSGRVSIRLASRGARVTLLDLSVEALRLASRFARSTKVNLVRGNLLHLPFPDEAFELVWNGGVLEHLASSDLECAVSEMARVTQRRGWIVSFNPNRASIAYRFGKSLQEKRGVWPYGFEEPIRSLAPLFRKNGVVPVREFDIGVAWSFSFVPEFPRRFVRTLMRMESLLRWIGAKGYLVTSVGRKE